MFSYLGLIQAALKLVSALASFFHDKGLIAAGAAQAVAAGTTAILDDLRKVAEVRAEAEADHAAGKIDDPFERD